MRENGGGGGGQREQNKTKQSIHNPNTKRRISIQVSALKTQLCQSTEVYQEKTFITTLITNSQAQLKTKHV